MKSFFLLVILSLILLGGSAQNSRFSIGFEGVRNGSEGGLRIFSQVKLGRYEPGIGISILPFPVLDQDLKIFAWDMIHDYILPLEIHDRFNLKVHAGISHYLNQYTSTFGSFSVYSNYYKSGEYLINEVSLDPGIKGEFNLTDHLIISAAGGPDFTWGWYRVDLISNDNQVYPDYSDQWISTGISWFAKGGIRYRF